MRKILLTLLSFAFLFVTASVVLAKDSSSSDENKGKEQKIVTLAVDEVVDQDYFAYGDAVEIFGTVNGDVYAAAGLVIIDGQINGDVLAAGGMVQILGNVSQDVRVVGGQLTVGGNVGGSLTAAGGSVDLASSAMVGKSAVIVGGNASLTGSVGENVKLGVGNLIASNSIGGDLEAGVGEARITSKAQIGGDFSYWSDQEAQVDEKAQIGGEVIKNASPFGKVEEAATKKAEGVFGSFGFIFKVFSLGSTLLIGLLFVFFTPRFLKSSTATLSKRPLASLGVGFVALITVPILFVVLLITIIGIPLAVILLVSYLISLYLAKIFAIFWLGTVVSRRVGVKIAAGWVYLVGIISYFLLIMVPYVGGLVTFLALLFGFGAFLLTKREFYQEAKKKELL